MRFFDASRFIKNAHYEGELFLRMCQFNTLKVWRAFAYKNMMNFRSRRYLHPKKHYRIRIFLPTSQHWNIVGKMLISLYLS